MEKESTDVRNVRPDPDPDLDDLYTPLDNYLRLKEPWRYENE